MARGSGQWGGPQHEEHMRELEVYEVRPRKQEIGCGWRIALALTAIAMAGLAGYIVADGWWSL